MLKNGRFTASPDLDIPDALYCTYNCMVQIGFNTYQFQKKIWKLETEVLMSLHYQSLPGPCSLTWQKNKKTMAGNKNALSKNIILFLL